MTTKYILAEQILLRLKGIENPTETEYSFQEIMLYLEQSIGLTVREFLANQVDDTQEIDGQITYTFKDLPIKKSKKKYYVELPATAIMLPMGRGVQEVYFSGNEEEVFKPLPSNHNVLYKNLIGADLDNQISYLIKEDTLILKNHGFDGTEDDGCGELTSVDVRMVIPLNGLGDDDFFIMPPMLQDSIIMKGLQFFSPQMPPIDNLNDNV